MIVIWGNNSWAVLTNVFLAGAAIIFGILEAVQFRTFWGFAAAAFFAVLGITSELARRKSARKERELEKELAGMPDERRCPDCGFLNDPRWNFCSNCGTPRGGRP